MKLAEFAKGLPDSLSAWSIARRVSGNPRNTSGGSEKLLRGSQEVKRPGTRNARRNAGHCGVVGSW